MRKIIIEEWISLDGYAEDQHEKLNFFRAHANRYPGEYLLKFLDDIDLILLDRKTSELFVDFWPTATTSQEIIADRHSTSYQKRCCQIP